MPARLRDCYHGLELGACLELVKALNKGASYAQVENMLEKQDHSGASYQLVCSMVSSFCDRGKDFVSYLERDVER